MLRRGWGWFCVGGENEGELLLWVAVVQGRG